MTSRFTPKVARSLALFQAADDGLALSWLAPFDGGGGNTLYEAKVCLGADQSQCSAALITASLSATFPGLQRGQSYRGWVNVRNEALSSGFVSSEALVVGDVPGAPRVSSAGVGSDPAVLTFSFCCADPKGNVVIAHQVERVDLSSGASVISNGTSPYVATDLARGGRYALRVRALTAAVPGDWSHWVYVSVPGRSDAPVAWVTSTVGPRTRPEAPASNTVVSTGRPSAPQA